MCVCVYICFKCSIIFQNIIIRSKIKNITLLRNNICSYIRNVRFKIIEGFNKRERERENERTKREEIIMNEISFIYSIVKTLKKNFFLFFIVEGGGKRICVLLF